MVLVYLLPISWANIILGSRWLANFGPHVADYAALTLKIFHQGKFLTLQGEGAKSATQAQLHHLRI